MLPNTKQVIISDLDGASIETLKCKITLFFDLMLLEIDKVLI